MILDESVLQVSAPLNANAMDMELTYTIVDGVSARGRSMLFDNFGHSYTLKAETGKELVIFGLD